MFGLTVFVDENFVNDERNARVKFWLKMSCIYCSSKTLGHLYFSTDTFLSKEKKTFAAGERCELKSGFTLVQSHSCYEKLLKT